MAYSELIKNFNRTRAYIRSFYVYGFRHRLEFVQKSARSYDDERRRVESWLGDYMSFGQDAEGRRVFLSVDSRAIPENPLYRAFRAKTFTDRDIMLHFHLLDILSDTEGFPISVIMDELAAQLSEFHSDDLPDESTVRKKLKEYAELGIVRTEKRGRETCYLLSEDSVDLGKWSEAIAFFSEAAPVGVIGSFLQDRLPERFSFFRFKHHYILNALDNEVLCELLMAINEKKTVSFTNRNRRITVLPRKLYIGTQSGRQYLLAWSPENRKFSFYRTDLIDNVKTEGKFAMVTCCNGNFYGGGFNPIKDANPADGQMNILLTKNISRVKAAGLIGAYGDGRYYEVPDLITRVDANKIHVKLDKVSVINIDGEAIYTDDLTVELIPGAVNFIVPEGMTYFDKKPE